MNRFTLVASTASAAAVLLALAGPAAAQADKAAAKPAAAASKPKAAAKPAADKSAAAKPAAKKAAAKPLPAASPEQLAAADRALKGDYACDFNQKLTVAANSGTQGYLDLSTGKSKYTMKPIITSTGTVRMEDVTGRMLLLQIANKSMLMDQKLGQRVADNCVHPSQRS